MNRIEEKKQYFSALYTRSIGKIPATRPLLVLNKYNIWFLYAVYVKNNEFENCTISITKIIKKRECYNKTTFFVFVIAWILFKSFLGGYVQKVLANYYWNDAFPSLWKHTQHSCHYNAERKEQIKKCFKCNGNLI